MRRFLMAALLLLAGAPAAAGESPPESPWLDHAAGVRRSAESGLPLLVVFGRAGCPFTAPAKAFLEGREFQAEFGERVVLAYVDGASDEGRPLVEKHRVESWPLAVIFSPSGEELWRTVAPYDATTARKEIPRVLDGSLSWRAQAALLRAGALDAWGTLALATAHRRRGEKDEAIGLFRAVADREEAETEARRLASAEIVEMLDRSERLPALEAHAREFPLDLDAALNLSFEMVRDPEVEPVRRERQLVATVAALREREEEFPEPFVRSGYRLARQYALYGEPGMAAWATPYVERALELRYSDDLLVELLALDLLAGRDSLLPHHLKLRPRESGAADADMLSRARALLAEAAEEREGRRGSGGEGAAAPGPPPEGR